MQQKNVLIELSQGCFKHGGSTGFPDTCIAEQSSK